MDLDKINRMAKKSFSNTYQCMQVANICVLYEKFDFDEQKAKDVTIQFAKYDKVDNDTGSAYTWAEIIKDEYWFDCARFALWMPYNQKVKLAAIPKGVHDKRRRDLMISNVESAVFTCFSVMMWTLKEFCGFGKAEFEKYLEGFLGVCKLFAKGMTLDWMIKFVQEEIGWEFEKCENSEECCKKMEGGFNDGK